MHDVMYPHYIVTRDSVTAPRIPCAPPTHPSFSPLETLETTDDFLVLKAASSDTNIPTLAFFPFFNFSITVDIQ